MKEQKIEDRKTKRLKKKKISFDEEVINKEEAGKLLFENQRLVHNESIRNTEKNTELRIKRKDSKNKRKSSENSSQDENIPGVKKKRITDLKKDDKEKDSEINTTEELLADQDQLSTQSKKESNRAKKRQKHAKLMEEKKLQSEVEIQQKSLNYLSKWKYSKSEWKFEKLRQVWLQQNLFDSSKIPNEFWNTTVEYFSGAKGQSREVVLNRALQIIDTEEENLNEDYSTKLKRARDIVQTLQ